MSPFHSGETLVQARRGVREDAARLGGMVREEIPAGARPFLARQRLAVAATLDARGRPWASLLEGPPGFLEIVDSGVLRVAARAGPGDPLHANLEARPELGLLVFDPTTRQRMRLNGRTLACDEDGVILRTDEVYGNCPKYIQKRRLLDPSENGGLAAGRGAPPPTSQPVRVTAALDARQQAFLAAADTFFIASHHPERGADASHRGGRPGFVRVEDASTLTFPDYPGNNMFNTLGNLVGYPQAGLLFLDFEEGDQLQVTGRTQVIETPEPGVRLLVDEVRETRGGSRLRWALVEPYPANP